VQDGQFATKKKPHSTNTYYITHSLYSITNLRIPKSRHTHPCKWTQSTSLLLQQ